MTPAELEEKYYQLELADRYDDSRIIFHVHRRCGGLVYDPDAHEKVCFDPPVQLDYDPEVINANRQKFINYQLGEKYS